MESKIVFCGDGGVGKTTIIERLTNGDFKKRYDPTTGIQIHTCLVEGKLWNIWDIAGQEKFSLDYEQIFESADRVAIFYDATSRITRKNVKSWEEKITDPVSDILYVRTKCDISEQKAEMIEGEIKISAKWNVNLEEIFE